MPSAPRLQLGCISKTYANGIEAVCRVGLDLEPGERMVIVGPSGSGKSTLLRILAGLTEPTAGNIVWDGCDITNQPPARRNLEMIFQSENLLPHLSVEDNLGFPLVMQRTDRAEIRRRVNEAADLLGLEQLLARRPNELSGGERQRVALGRVFAGRKPIWLLDEPLSSVDPAQRSDLRCAIRRLHEHSHATVIHVTHDQTEALSLGQRVAVMHAGEILQVDPPEVVYRRPACPFVARFVGDPAMNLWEAPVVDGSIQVLGTKLPLDVRPDGAKVTVGIRPEDFELGSGWEIQFAGSVTATEFLGRSHLVELAVAGCPLRVMVARASLPIRGQSITVGCQRDAVHVFDPSGRRLN